MLLPLNSQALISCIPCPFIEEVTQYVLTASVYQHLNLLCKESIFPSTLQSILIHKLSVSLTLLTNLGQLIDMALHL